MSIDFTNKKIKASSWVMSCLKSMIPTGRAARRQARAAKPTTRLLATLLEDRVTPTTLHWIGSTSGNGNLWSVAANWQEDVVPASGDRLVFDTTTPGFSSTTNGFAPMNDLTGLTNLSIGINDTSAAGGDFTISGNPFGLVTTAGVGITSTLSIGTVETINNNITLNANTTVSVGVGALTLGGIISGGFSLTAAGSPASTLTLNVGNTYSGGTTLTSGILSVGANTSLGTGPFNLNGGTLAETNAFLTVPNSFVVSAPSTITGGAFFTISGNGTLNANLRVYSLTLSGGLSGTGGLIVDGGGSALLGGNTPNTFTGPTTIVSGQLTLEKGPGINALVSPVTILGGSGSITLNNDDQINGNASVSLGQGSNFNTDGYYDTVSALTGLGKVNLASTSTTGLTVTGGGAQLLAAQFTGSGYFTYAGTGSLTLAGDSSSYTGTLTVAKGTLDVDANFSSAPTVVTGGILAGTGIVSKISASGGTVDPASAGAGSTLGTATGSLVSSLSGATFQADLTPQLPSDQLALGSNATLSLAGATLVVTELGSSLADTYQIITSPTGGLSGTFNSLPNGSTITVGSQTLKINYTIAAVTLTNIGATTTTLHWTGTTDNNWSIANNWAEHIIPASGDTLVFDTTAPGFANTTAAFAPANDLSGLTNMVIVLNDASTTGDFSISGNAFGLVNSAGLGIVSTLSAGTTATISNNLTLAANTTVSVGLGTLTLSGVISGSTALIVAGSQEGTLDLGGANLYTGGTTLTDGTVSIATNTSLGTGQITFNGGTLANTNAFLQVANSFVVSTPSTIGGGSFFNLNGDGTLNANLRLTNSGFLTLAGAISGTGGLIEDGFPGYGILSGTTANTFTGATTVISGDLELDKTAGVNAIVAPISLGGGAFPTLSWGASDQVNDQSSITSGANCTLNTNGYTDAVAMLSGAGAINLGSTATAGLTVTGSGTNLVTGTVSGSGFLTYNGTGTLILGGTSSSYTGELDAAGGTLVVDANFAYAPAVTQSGGTLGGTGFVELFATSSTGTINPGGSGVCGLLSTASGSYASILSGQTYAVDLTDTGLSDQLAIGDSTTINLANATLSVNVIHSSYGTVYPIITSATGGISGTFLGLPDGTTFALSGHQFKIHYTAYEVTLTDLQAITLSPGSLPAGEVGVTYNQTIVPIGGVAPVTLTVSNVTNTTGLTISGSGTGTISLTGTPTSSGTVTFLVTPSDANGPEAGTAYNITINAPVVLNPTTLPTGEVGVAYSQTITGTGGSGTITLSLSSVTNTTGLTISGSGTGTITLSGTPTSSGTVSFTVTPTDAIGTGTGTMYSFLIEGPVVLNPSTLPGGEVGDAYSQSITSTGGDAPVTLAVSSITNTTGLTISGSGTGTISLSGTPTSSGTVKFTVTPTDQIGTGTGKVYSFSIIPGVVLSPGSLPDGEVGLSYSQSITASGGSGAITLSVSGVTNTTGVTISGSGTGTIGLSGTPTSSGIVTFTVTPTDSIGTGPGKIYSFTVDSPVVLDPTTLPGGEDGVAYDQTISGSGGAGAISLALSGITNTTGITISGSGTDTISLTGTPTTSGTVSFTVTPTDGVGTGSGIFYSFAVDSPVVLNPSSLPGGEVGIAYSQTITSTGGTAPVTLGVSGVTNTTGLTISGSGTGTISVSGTPTSSGTVTFTVTPTDMVGTGTGTLYSFTVSPAIVLSPGTLPAGQVGLAYSQSITGSGGSGSITLTLSGVTNTTGLTISGSGTGTITLTGTPTSTGTVSFTVTPTDSIGTGSAKTYSFAVDSAFALTPTSLPDGEAGLAYSQSITSTGGAAPVTLAVSGVTNTTGLTISGSGTGTIALSGTPTSAGTVTFTVTPSDPVGTGTGTLYSFTVNAPVVLTPATLPAGEVGLAYSQSLTASGGSGAITLALSGVTNTTGLTISGNGTGTISIAGTPTSAGTVSFTVTPTDSIGTGSGKLYSFTVAPPVSLNPTTLPGGEVGLGYDQTITGSGGYGMITLALSGITNTTGLTISGSGTGTISLSGTPDATGTVTFTVTPTDSVGANSGTLYSFTVSPSVVLTPSTLPGGEAGIAYSQSITSTGGAAPVTLGVSGVTNTTGLTISGSGTGTISVSGTPTSSGTVTFTVTPTDTVGASAGTIYSFTVSPAIVLSPGTLPDGQLALAYNQTITGSGGNGTITLALSGVTNSTGLTISGSGTGTITLTGTPTTSGTVSFTVTPTDSIGTGPAQTYSFAVASAVALTPTSLPDGEVGAAYSQSITSTGGAPPVTLTVSGVTNTTGLIISGSGTGTISLSGIPTAAGTVTFTVTPTSAAGTTMGTNYTFTVGPAIVLSPTTLPGGEVGFAYNQSITGSGGSGTITLNLSGVTNTTGLTISGSDTGSIGIIGTPTSAGTVSFTVTPSDAIGTGTAKTYSFTIAPPVSLNPTTLPGAEEGLVYNKTITASGGSGTISLALSGVTNTTGLTISGNGTGTISLSGTPSAGGTVTFTVTPTDSFGTTSGSVYSFTVSPPVVLSPSTLPGGEVGVAYNQSITASGGAASVTLAVSGVTNTTGLTISGNGTGTITLSGTPTSSGTVTFTVTPTDKVGTSTGTLYSFTVSPAIVLSPGTLPTGQVGLAYSQSITDSGGNGTITLALSGVTNSTGLTISGSGTGTITLSGTPTTSGTVSFTVTPTDSIGTGPAKTYSFTVASAVTTLPASLPAGEVGQSYDHAIVSSGGVAPVTLTVLGITNTTGLSIDGSETGVVSLSGVPTSAGTVTFTVTPSDSVGTGTGTLYSFTINPALTLTPTTLSAAHVGTSYSQTITSTGGVAPVTLAVSSVTNATGLTISGTGTGTISISGTPTSAGIVSFIVTPTDGTGTGEGTEYSLDVNAGTSPPPPPPPPPTGTPQPVLVGGLPNGMVQVYTDSNGTYTLQETLQPFGNIPTDVRTAVGDVNGDGIPDYIFAIGPSPTDSTGAAIAATATEFQVMVLSGASGNPVLVQPFDPFLPNPGGSPFTAGGFVSAGDFLNNGRAQIVVSPDQQGGPRIAIYDMNGAATAGPQPATPFGHLHGSSLSPRGSC